MPSPAVPRLISSFLHMMRIERGAATHTLDNYKRDLLDLADSLATRKKRLENATTDDLRRYLHRLHSAGYAPRTSARRLSAIKQFYMFLYGERLRQDDPAQSLDGPRLDQPLPKYLTEGEIKHLLNTAAADKTPKGRRTSAVLELLYGAGLRISEALTLPIHSGLRDQETLIITGKGQKERMVPLSNSIQQALALYRPHRATFLKKGAESPWLFPAPRAKDGHLTRQIFDQDLKALGREAQINKPLSAHVLRHSFATHLLDHDMDLRSVQQLLGHADIATTTLYTHITGQREQRLVNNAHPLAALHKVPPKE